MGNKRKMWIIIATAIAVAIVLAIILSLRGCSTSAATTEPSSSASASPSATATVKPSASVSASAGSSENADEASNDSGETANSGNTSDSNSEQAYVAPEEPASQPSQPEQAQPEQTQPEQSASNGCIPTYVAETGHYETTYSSVHHNAVYNTVHHDAVTTVKGGIQCGDGTIFMQDDYGGGEGAVQAALEYCCTHSTAGGYHSYRKKVVVTPAYDEQVLVSAAYDEQVPTQTYVVDSAAHYEGC
jgi:hypothetical protein